MVRQKMKEKLMLIFRKNCKDKVIRIEGIKSTEKFYSAFDIFCCHLYGKD